MPHMDGDRIRTTHRHDRHSWRDVLDDPGFGKVERSPLCRRCPEPAHCQPDQNRFWPAQTQVSDLAPDYVSQICHIPRASPMPADENRWNDGLDWR